MMPYEIGIIEEKIFPLSNRDVGGIITQGGTMLKQHVFQNFKMKKFNAELMIF